ncbi:hypothetical protein [uncultured Fusobacterium sp.]|jgi:hypothetical protein|uniref:hypothetical protein n=1 Tax=uncultured Fusobacterium sp. TaxID=159267 RepID=UPI0025D5CD24|nr:hypothetical protein [uncultured Fusobacterium sp.]
MAVLSIQEGIVTRLQAFKYNVQENETSILDYLTLKTISSINNLTNQFYTADTIPQDLYSIVVDKIVGEFLLFKKNTGDIPSLDLSPVEKQIQAGDTSITYAVENITSPEKMYDLLIDYLISSRDKELMKYRRLVW